MQPFSLRSSLSPALDFLNKLFLPGKLHLKEQLEMLNKKGAILLGTNLESLLANI